MTNRPGSMCSSRVPSCGVTARKTPVGRVQSTAGADAAASVVGGAIPVAGLSPAEPPSTAPDAQPASTRSDAPIHHRVRSIAVASARRQPALKTAVAGRKSSVEPRTSSPSGGCSGVRHTRGGAVEQPEEDLMNSNRRSSAVLCAMALVLTACAAGPAASAGPTIAGRSASSSDARSATYSSTTFAVPFDVDLPGWLPAQPSTEEPNFVTWESTAEDRKVRMLLPVVVYRPGEVQASVPPA